MKNQIFGIAHAILFSFAVSNVAQATPITGSVDIGVTVQLNATLGSATGALATSGTVIQGDGSYDPDGKNFSSVSFAAFSWSPVIIPGGSLWSFTDSLTGWNYGFTLTSVNSVSQSSSHLDISGFGTLFITGAGSTFEPGEGVWGYTITDADGEPNSRGKFVFNSNNSPRVPDEALTALLLGCGVAMLGLFARLNRALRRV